MTLLIKTHHVFSSYPSCMKHLMNTLDASPDALEILSDIPARFRQISIEIIRCQKQKALWSWNEKKITFDASFASNSEANKLAYLIFESCNATQSDEFIKAAELSNIDNFVEGFERIEHRSAQRTNRVITKILGSHVEFEFKYVYDDFCLHYALQQIGGHSESIAQQRFSLQKYRGTLYYPLSELNDEVRDHLYALLYYYVRREDKESREAFNRTLNMIKKSDQNPIYAKVFDCAISLFYMEKTSKKLDQFFIEGRIRRKEEKKNRTVTYFVIQGAALIAVGCFLRALLRK